ncbi:MAG: PH domain-containing protein [Rikenellaceae bacterium]
MSRYNFNFGRHIYYWTILYIVVVTLLGAALYKLYDGGFLSAWFASFVMALLLLMALSIPRKIIIDDRRFAIHSLLDLTVIDIDQISSISKISPRQLRWTIPIFGSYGFFGYFGHYFDLRNFRRVKIYASEWRYLVEIIDAYDDYYYVSCRKRDKLIAELREKGVVNRTNID